MYRVMAAIVLTLAFATFAAAQTPALSLIQTLITEFNASEPAVYKLNPLTPQLLETLIEPITTAQIARNSYVYRQGSELRLNGKQWTASGANVYMFLPNKYLLNESNTIDV